MKHPAYHLRPNKMAERFAFIESIRRLERLSAKGLKNYTYLGLGGPYLEDFRLLNEFFPDISMISIETEDETCKRQRFHLPSSNVQLVNSDIESFIAQYDPGSMKSVFWLDYTDLKLSNFEEFKAVLGLVEKESMVKVTLRCDPRDYGAIRNEKRRLKKAEEFRSMFRKFMPLPSADPPRRLTDFAAFLQSMLQVAAEQAFPPLATELTLVPVTSFCYSDGSGMLTLTGVVCERDGRSKIENIYEDWTLANLNWNPPKLIDVPVLSTKERLHVQSLLPLKSTEGPTLRKALGYLIDEDIPKTEAALEQYAAFHSYSPYFLRGEP